MKKKILVLDIKDKKTIPQAIIQNVLWYETINEGKSYVRIQLHWFKFMICQRIKKKKITNFLCVCGALPRSSVWQCQLYLFPSEKSPQGHFDFRWMNTILKNTWERIIELENQVLYEKMFSSFKKNSKKKKKKIWNEELHTRRFSFSGRNDFLSP